MLVLTLLAVSIKDAPVEEITELPSGLPRKQTQATQKYTTEARCKEGHSTGRIRRLNEILKRRFSVVCSRFSVPHGSDGWPMPLS